MAQSLVSQSSVWSSFKSLLDGGDLNEETKVRRQMYASANELEEEPKEELPEVKIDTLQLFDPAARLQPVPRESKLKPATIGPVPKGQETRASEELDAGDERPKITVEEFKQSQPGFAASPFLEVIEKLAPDAQSQIVGAFADVISNTSEGIGLIFGEGDDGFFTNLARKIPEIEKSDKLGANLVRGVTQFSTIFIPMLGVSNRVLQGANIATKGIAADAAASAFSDFFAFKGTDARLTDLVVELAPQMKEWPHVGSLLEYLDGDPSDTELEGRWKNVVEGQVLTGLTGVVLNPKKAARAFFNTTKQVQRVNYISKYTNNQVGAIGDPGSIGKFSMAEANQGRTRLSQAKVDKAQQIKQPAKRIQETREAMRATQFTEEQVNRMADEFSIPLEDANNLLQHGVSKPIAEQAALVGTIRNVNKEIKAITTEVANNPFKSEGYDALDAKIDELGKLYASYVGSGSEAGARLNAQQMLNKVLQQSGLERTLSAIQSYKLGTRDEKLLFAQRMQGVADRDVNQFLKMTGAHLNNGKRIQEAIAEAYIGTRFTPLSVAKNTVSNALFTVGLVGERALAAALGPKNSPITFKESIYLAHGMMADIDTAFKAYLDQTFRPGKNPAAVNMNTKIDAFEPAITSQRFGLEGTAAGGMLDAMGHLIRFFPNQMQATDEAFKTVLRRGELQAQAYREAVKHGDEISRAGITDIDYKTLVNDEYKRLMKDPPAELLEKADQFAHYGTFTDAFTDKTAGGQLAQSYQNFSNEHPMIKVLIPFFKTPVRITQAGAKRVPGLGAKLTDSQELGAATEAERIALSRAKQAMGGLVGITGIGLWASGDLIGQGPPPTDQKGRELMNMRGQQPFSLVAERFPDGRPKSVIPLGDLPGPYNAALRLFSVVGETTKIMWDRAQNNELTRDQEKAFDDYVSGATATIAKTFEDQVFFRNLLSIMANAKMGNGKAINRFLASTIPAMSAEVAKDFDSMVKESETLGEAFMEKLPFARSSLSTKTDVLGQDYIEGMGVFPEQAPPGLVGYLSTRVNPLSATGNWDATNQVIMDFQGEHLDKLAGIKATKNLGEVKLDPEQQNVFNKIRIGMDATTSNGVVIPGIKDRQGLTLKQRWLQVITEGNGDDRFKVAAYNKYLGAYTKLAIVQLRKHYDELDAELKEVQLTGKGAVVGAVTGTTSQ